MLRRRGKADEALPSHSDADPLLDGKPGTPVGPAGLRHISADRNLRSILRRIKQRPLAFFLGLATFLYEIFVLVAPKVPTDLCLGFKATLYASPYSLRDPSRDLGCSVRVPAGTTGFCECARRISVPDATHSFTCDRVCGRSADSFILWPSLSSWLVGERRTGHFHATVRDPTAWFSLPIPAILISDPLLANLPGFCLCPGGQITEVIRLDIHAAKKQLWPTTCDQSCARLKYFNQRAGHSALAEGASQFQGGLWSEYSLRTWRNSGMDTRKLWYNVHESQCLASGPSDNPKRIKLVRTGCRAWHTTGGGAVGYSRAGRSRSCYEKIPARLHGFCECEDGRLVLLAPPDGRGGRGALEGVAVGPNRERYQTCHDACTIGVPSVSVVDNAKGASLLPAFERAGCLHFQGTYEGKRYALRSPGAKLHCDEPLFFGYSSGHCACEGGFAGFQAAHEGFDPTRVPGTCRQACAMWARPPGVSIVDCPGLMPGAGKCNVLDRSHVDEVLRTALGGPPMAASVAGPAVTLPDPDQVALLSRAWEESHTGHWIFPRAVRLEGRETKVRYSRTEITEIRQRYRIWMSHVAGTTAGLGRDLDGQGIVTAARGPQEMLAVAGMLRNLRLLGCTLPVEVVVQHGDVPSVALAEDLAALGARAVDLDATLWYMLHPHPASLYAWAVLASSFEEILWMSPEVVPLQDPTSLFRDRKYQDAGLLLWQDVWAPSQLADMWHIMELDASSKAALPLTRGTFAGTHFMLNLRQRWTTVLSWAWTAQPGVLPLLSGPIRSGSQEALAVAAAMSGEPFALADPRPATVGAPTDSLFLDHAGTLHFHPTANSPLFIVDAAPAWMGEYPLRRELLRVRWRVVRQCEEVLPVPSGVGARDAIITGCETQPHELEDMMRRAGFRHDAESVHWAAMLEAQCMPGVSAALSAAAHRTGVSGFGDDGAMRKCADVWAAVGTMGDELPFSRPFCSVRRKDNKRMEERPWQPWTVHATVRNGTVTNDSIT